MQQIDKRGGIALFKIVTPAVFKEDKKTKKQVLAVKASVAYRTYPVDHLNDPEFAKDFPTLFAARATMPPIPDTNPKTPGRAEMPHNQPGYKAGNGFKQQAKKK